MKSNLKLTAENIGNVICIKTVDNFVCEGHIKSVTDTTVEINDFKSKNILTIFTFEIKEFDIIRGDGKVEKSRPVVKPVPVKEVKEPNNYEHPIFGRLSRDETPLQFVNETADGTGIDFRDGEGLYEIHYIYVNGPTDAYRGAMRCLEEAGAVGVSFYHNEYRQEGAFKFVTLSWRPHWSLVIDANGLAASEFRTRFPAVVELLRNERQLKLVHGGGNIVPAMRSALRVELAHFIDVQLLHYGLHNARVAERFRTGLSYGQMVQLLFGTAFPPLCGSSATSATTMTDVLHKIAFNAHFLVPIYELMLARLLEPVRLLSARLARTDPDAWERDPALLDLNLSQSASIDYEILPRSLQFWSYRDNAPALRAKRVVDNEMQHEKRAAAVSNGPCDVAGISKTLARAQERAQCGDAAARGYYEEISDDDSEERAFNESGACWKRSGGDTIDAANAISSVAVAATAVVAPIKRGLGRGRGVMSAVPPAAPAVATAAISPPIATPIGTSTPIARPHAPVTPTSGHTSQPPPIETARNATGSSGGMFSKGRGVSGGFTKGSTRSHSSKTNSRGGTDSMHRLQQLDEPEESFCEMAIHRWNRNGPSAAANLSLCLDQFSTDDGDLPSDPGHQHQHRWSQQQQAMGIMWNSVGLSKAKEMDDLYDEFGLH